MEESHGSASTMPGLEDREVLPPLDAGRLGGFLCQLQRARFDGVLHVECGARCASIGFRAGTPVTFDDPAQGHTLADQFVERGQLTRAQTNEVLARMTDGLVDDEAVAFCEHAVQLGFLSEDEASVELSSRIRARMIQLFALRDCHKSVEPGEAALFGRREFPQDLGAIVYVGVRTFYEEDFLTRCHPDLTQTYVQLLAAPATIAHFFGLDDEEFQLLRRLSPELPAAKLLEDRRVDRVHLLGLLLLMRLAGFCEVYSSPLSQQPNAGQSVAQRVPAPPEEPSTSTQADPSGPADPLLVPPAPRPTAKPSVDATQEALLEAAARTARMRRLSGRVRRSSLQAEGASATNMNAATIASSPSEQISDPPAPPVSQRPVQPRPEYAKAHLSELIARRKHAASQTAAEAAAGGARDSARELREARGLLHAQHYARAEKVLAALVELEPANDVFKTYHLWSRWRAQPETADDLTGPLLERAKKLIADSEHAGFAAYVLGHVYFHAKRDDLAERFFKRAHHVDRGNKDAERHLRILERRKQNAAEAAAGANRKLFGIQLPNSKPKS